MTNSIIIFSAKYLYLVAAAIYAAYFLITPKRKKVDFVMLTVVALPVIFLLSRILSRLYFDPRPFVVGHFTPLIPHAADNGFPSDHALLTGALAAVMYFLNKKTSTALWLLALAVGAARVAAGIHHWTDIFGGFAIAIAGAIIAEYVLRRQRLFAYKS